MTSSGPLDDPVDALRPIVVSAGVVTRPASAWTPTVHTFLRYLRDQGLTCVPEPLGVGDGVERVSYLPGDAGADGWGHQHTEAGLRSAARLLRTVHDASRGWVPPDDAVWGAAVVPAAGPDDEVVACHGDVGPWNVVWRDGTAVGLIDWDFLHPAPRADDLAYALRWFAPARSDELALAWHHFATVPDRAARIAAFLDEYGPHPAFDVVGAMAARAEATMALELSLATLGVEPQRTWVHEGSQARAAEEVRWIREHRALLTP